MNPTRWLWSWTLLATACVGHVNNSANGVPAADPTPAVGDGAALGDAPFDGDKDAPGDLSPLTDADLGDGAQTDTAATGDADSEEPAPGDAAMADSNSADPEGDTDLGIAPPAPTVTALTPTRDNLPQWSWSSSGGTGSGQFRYKLDNSNLALGSTVTAALSFQPASALPDATHTLYVQEQSATGLWSASGSRAVLVDTTPPTVAKFELQEGGVACAYTPDNNFAVSLGVADLLGSGVFEMRLRNSDDSFGAWQAYSNSVSSFVGASGYGTKVVQAEFSDRAGNVAQAQASIFYDDSYEGCYGNNDDGSPWDLGVDLVSLGSDNFVNLSTTGVGRLYDEDWFYLYAPADIYLSLSAWLTSGAGNLQFKVLDDNFTVLGDTTVSSGMAELHVDNCVGGVGQNLWLIVGKPDAAWGATYDLAFGYSNDGCL